MKGFLSNNKGVGLTEVLVAIPLVAILLSGILNLLSVAVISYQTSKERMATQQTARFAIDSMVREVQADNADDTIIKKITTIEAGKMVVEKKKNGVVTEIITYSLDTKTKQLTCKKNDSAPVPVTGNALTPIFIEKLEFSNVKNPGTEDPLPNIVSIELKTQALNAQVPVSYTIKTTITAS